MVAPAFFAKPNVQMMPLQVPPRLASWMASGHPDQTRMEKFLIHAEGLLADLLRQTPDPVALRLDVGLPRHVALLEQHDLDNYAFPLAMRLSKSSGHQFATVWVTKQHAGTSSAGVRQAVPRPRPSTTDHWFAVHTTVSSATTLYKQQIHDQLHAAKALPDGPVAIELAFTVGPRRNWLNLWKPTIDALDALLGPTSPDRRWHPRDGRIVELALHRQVDPSYGNDTSIAIAATVWR